MTTLAHLERTYLHYLAFANEDNFTLAVLGNADYDAYTADKAIIDAEINRLNKIHVAAAIKHLKATTTNNEFTMAIREFDKNNLNRNKHRYQNFNRIVNDAISVKAEVSNPVKEVTPAITKLIQQIHNKILNSDEFQTKANTLGFQPDTVANLKSASKAFDNHFDVGAAKTGTVVVKPVVAAVKYNTGTEVMVTYQQLPAYGVITGVDDNGVYTIDITVANGNVIDTNSNDTPIISLLSVYIQEHIVNNIYKSVSDQTNVAVTKKEIESLTNQLKGNNNKNKIMVELSRLYDDAVNQQNAATFEAVYDTLLELQVPINKLQGIHDLVTAKKEAERRAAEKAPGAAAKPPPPAKTNNNNQRQATAIAVAIAAAMSSINEKKTSK